MSRAFHHTVSSLLGCLDIYAEKAGGETNPLAASSPNPN